MKTTYAIAIAVAVLLEGCATSDVNPLAAKTRTGYVDFYVDDASGLCWQIRRLGTDERKKGILFEEFKPRTNGIVRLAFSPGEHRLGITFLNRAITEPGIASVVIEDGKITPVRLTLVETGKAMIETRRERIGASYARTGRSTKVRASEGATFRVEAEAQEPMPYQPKERMPFASEMEKTDT